MFFSATSFPGSLSPARTRGGGGGGGVGGGGGTGERDPVNEVVFSVRKRAVFLKSRDLIGSGSGWYSDLFSHSARSQRVVFSFRGATNEPMIVLLSKINAVAHRCKCEGKN